MAHLLSRNRTKPGPGTPPARLRRIGVLLAGAITAGLLSAAPASADPAPAAPITLVSVTATADDQLYALAADHTAVYRWNGKGTDWTKVGGPAQDLYVGGAGLFATSLGSGALNKYNGQPGDWSQIGGAGADFAVTGDHLYGLNPDRSAVYEWNGTGTDWTRIGGPAQDLEAGGAGLFATSPDGKLHKYNGQPDTWSEIGGAGADFAVTSDHLYGLNPDRTAVYEWNGKGTDWTKVGGPAQDLHAGGAGLFATSPDDKLHKYDRRADTWTEIGNAGKAFAVGSTRLYGLASDGNSVHRWSGQGADWTALGAPSAPGAPVPQAADPSPEPQSAPPGMGSEAQDGAEAESVPEAGSPSSVRGALSDIAGPELSVTAKGDLYALAPDHGSVWKHEGDNHWTKIGGPAESVHAGRLGVFARHPDTGAIYRYDGEIGRWSQIGDASADLEVTGDHLYRLSSDRSAVFEWSGQGTDWTKIGGPADQLYAVGGPADQLYAGGAGLFATRPDTGHLYQYNGTPDHWTEIGTPGAAFAVSGEHLYGLSPDRSAVFERTSGDNWQYRGGPSEALQAVRDEDTLRELRGDDYVRQYRQASILADTKLMEWLAQNGAGILLELLGVKDIEKCLSAPGKEKIKPCLLAAANFSTVITAVRKADKVQDAIKTVAVGLPRFRSEVVAARNVVVQAREILDRNAKDLADDFTVNKPDRADCRRNGAGWLDLGTRDVAHGSRATAMNACLDTAYLTAHAQRGSPTTAAVRPPGYNWATATAGYLRIKDIPQRINNCHLLGKQLTGSGEDLDNLVTCSRAANAQVKGDEGFANDMKALEGEVKKAVDAGQVVRYQVTPVYSGPRTVPVKLEISAVGMYPDGRPGGVLIKRAVENKLFQPQTQKWHNLGLWVMNGKAVPTGNTP
ncbi:DNA/RNA non-specific endonuclease [Streptomyces lavendulae]|uniref:DNA/RNA non-specific endonuclease n=1 Tax=Streptomyces lavendulae TaxID=1914 RepID=UPI0004C251A7|nr:DNA/RNA non-specific endonuclease [Streptomyces lavendulae]